LYYKKYIRKEELFARARACFAFIKLYHKINIPLFFFKLSNYDLFSAACFSLDACLNKSRYTSKEEGNGLSRNERKRDKAKSG